MIQDIYCALLWHGISAKHAAAIRRRLRLRPDGCIEWLGAHTGGRPVWSKTVAKKGLHFKLHRLIYCAVNKVALGSDDILQPRCGFLGCCNPGHAFVEDRAVMHSKNNLSKNLDWDRVRRIRSGELSDAEYARWFGMSRSTVRRVRLHQTWRENVQA